MKKMVRTGTRILSALGITLMVLLAVFLVGPYILQLKPYAVLSGSMQPTYPTGSLIYVQKTSPEQIAVGTPITFTRSAMVVTHRVVQIDTANRVFYTKGDANNTQDDGAVSFQDLIGKPVFEIPYLGYASVYFSRTSGRIILATVFLCLLIIAFLPDALSKINCLSTIPRKDKKRKET